LLESSISLCSIFGHLHVALELRMVLDSSVSDTWWGYQEIILQFLVVISNGFSLVNAELQDFTLLSCSESLEFSEVISHILLNEWEKFVILVGHGA